ncbi:hypothetical protein [Burkholderia pseudomallei]|uniref:hypothetical protein n=1 Tax=Burkholderia pseudomallei TaxID=28450 RepID=UPI00053784A7|nr:hypothetical protein [Burkholderia pseudomallei]KGW65270.1 hypothetical protein Y039_1353 [Burkholderia pseudomallei MSHR1029]
MGKIFDLTNERKLTDQDALVIRAIHIPRSPRFGSVILAQLFGVSQPTIDRVVKRETYRHLHPLLLPGRQIWNGSDMLGYSDTPLGEWARNKTEYRAAQSAVREEFVSGGYVDGLNGEHTKNNAGVYKARPVRRVIKPEVEQQRRAKLRLAGLRWALGANFDESIGLAAAALAPKLPPDEYTARTGKPAGGNASATPNIDLAELRCKLRENSR